MNLNRAAALAIIAASVAIVVAVVRGEQVRYRAQWEARRNRRVVPNLTVVHGRNGGAKL